MLMVNKDYHFKKLCSRDYLQAMCEFTPRTAVLRFCAYTPFWGGLGVTYNVYLQLIGKRVMDLLLVLIELLCYVRGTTSEYQFKIGDFAPTGTIEFGAI